MSKYKLLAYRYLLTSWYVQDYPNSKPHLTADQIRTGLSIDYYIGPCIPHSKGNVISTCTVPTVLLYDEPDMGNSISTIGIAGFNSKDTWPEDIIRLQTPQCLLSQDDIYYSLAHLNNVRSVRVFYDQNAYYCKGILFLYDDRA